MKNKNRTAFLGFGAFFLFGCIIIIALLRAIYSSPVAAPAVQPSPLPPEVIGTMIVQTGVAAASQTAGVSGTQTSQFYTPTYTMTITPLGGARIRSTGTPLPDGSIPNAATFETSTRFVLAKWTPSITATTKPKNPNKTADGKKPSAVKTADAGTPEASDFTDNRKKLECSIRSTTPAANTVFSPNQNFNAKWVVSNTGTDWLHNSVDISFGSGVIGRFADIYNIDTDVTWGERYTFIVPLKAPNAPGKYSSIWYLRASQIKFCELRVFINVQ